MYVFWTSLWYLYIFFFMLITTSVFMSYRLPNLLFVGLILFFFIYNFSLYLEIWQSNTFTSYIDLSGGQINILLKNSINKIHPLLLYSSLSALLMFRHHVKLYKGFYFEVDSVLIVLRNLKHTFFFIILALYLGSWWALQEGSWGGWWNWDASEFLGLIIFYILLLSFHSNKNMLNILFIKQWLQHSVLYLILFFLLLQLNFSTISHNFGFRTLRFLNTEALLLSFFLLSLSKYICAFLEILKARGNILVLTSKFVTCSNILKFLTISFNFILIMPLLTLFLTSLINFKFFFNFLNFSKLLIFLFFSIFLQLLKIQLFLALFLLNTFTKDFYLIYLNIINKYFQSVFTIHYIILILFMFNLLYPYSILNDYLVFNLLEVDFYLETVALSSHDIELFLNFLITTTTFENKSFDLLITQNYVFQIYFLNTLNWNYTVTTVDIAPPILNTLLCLAVCIILNYCRCLYRF